MKICSYSCWMSLHLAEVELQSWAKIHDFHNFGSFSSSFLVDCPLILLDLSTLY